MDLGLDSSLEVLVMDTDLSMIVDEDGPAEKFAFTKTGEKIDLANISGKKKIDLIRKNHFRIDSFVAPANMPGKKLAAMREEHRKRVEAALKSVEIAAGAVVSYKDVEYEVIAADKATVLIPKDGKKVRVKITSVTLVKPAPTE